MRYQGTNIDGPGLDPECLNVRGSDLNDLVGNYHFLEVLFHLITERFPSAEEVEIINDFYLASVTAVEGCDAEFDIIFQTAVIANDPTKVWVAGLLFDFQPKFNELYAGHSINTLLNRAEANGLFSNSLTIIYLAISKSKSPGDYRQALANIFTVAKNRHTAFITLFFKIAFEKNVVEANEMRLFEDLLIAWHAGFGYLTPSVMAARVAAGTGASTNMILISGIVASGPLHIGASKLIFSFMQQLSNRDPAKVKTVIEEYLNANNRLYGFGHPLFKRDPRIAKLFESWKRNMPENIIIQLYEAISSAAFENKGLNPNIDFITACILLSIGVTNPFMPLMVSLFSRSIAMIAHAEEKKAKPAFGIKSSDARKYLREASVTWI